jgi:hypothetical protein
MKTTSSIRNGDEGELKMSQGILYLGRASSALRDFLTWHDIGDKRIWLHTRKGQGSSRLLVSFSLQQFDGQPPSVSAEEKRARLRLAATHEFQGNQELTATSLRTIALGELSEIHAAAIFEVISNAEKSNQKKISLASEFTSQLLSKSSSFRFDSINETSQLGANSKDALLIAKVYSQISDTGAKNVAKRCAQVLNVETELVYVALRIARKHEWLTSFGSGKSGGQMTEEGEKEFRKSKGHERLARILSADWIYTD